MTIARVDKGKGATSANDREVVVAPKKHFFATGKNMSSTPFMRDNPRAKYLGVAKLKGYRWTITGPQREVQEGAYESEEAEEAQKTQEAPAVNWALHGVASTPSYADKDYAIAEFHDLYGAVQTHYMQQHPDLPNVVCHQLVTNYFIKNGKMVRDDFIGSNGFAINIKDAAATPPKMSLSPSSIQGTQAGPSGTNSVSNQLDQGSLYRPTLFATKAAWISQQYGLAQSNMVQAQNNSSQAVLAHPEVEPLMPPPSTTETYDEDHIAEGVATIVKTTDHNSVVFGSLYELDAQDHEAACRHELEWDFERLEVDVDLMTLDMDREPEYRRLPYTLLFDRKVAATTFIANPQRYHIPYRGPPSFGGDVVDKFEMGMFRLRDEERKEMHPYVRTYNGHSHKFNWLLSKPTFPEFFTARRENKPVSLSNDEEGGMLQDYESEMRTTVLSLGASNDFPRWYTEEVLRAWIPRQ